MYRFFGQVEAVLLALISFSFFNSAPRDLWRTPHLLLNFVHLFSSQIHRLAHPYPWLLVVHSSPLSHLTFPSSRTFFPAIHTLLWRMVADNQQAQVFPPSSAAHQQIRINPASNVSNSVDHLTSLAPTLTIAKSSFSNLSTGAPHPPQITHMELHDATGAILREFPVNAEANSATHQTHISGQSSLPMSHAPPQQQNPQHPADAKHEPAPVQTNQQAPSAGNHSQHPHPQAPPPNTQNAATSQLTATTDAQGATQPSIANSADAVNKKSSRMPGTKQCPSCHNTIAAAVAKCPKCPHIFREKKEKVKRSGKRGKKNCPKCNFENPSACSSCKNCKHVFRLKLIDKYKAMRPRSNNESAVAAAAAAAHAAANMAHPAHGGVTAVATVPLPAGVAAFPHPIGTQIHQGQVIPPLSQHSIGMHPQQHSVHPTAVAQMHSMPQAGMHPHQTHPQL